jgi:Leucine-rich repeat (LRR) protein
MTTKEESELNGCSICMDEKTIGPNGCISPSDEPFGAEPAGRGCNHYACKSCWNQVMKMSNKCFVCQKTVPLLFMNDTNVKLLKKIIKKRDPLKIKYLNLSNSFLPTKLWISFPPISSLINLTVLNLNHQFISDISPISSLTKLKKLYLDSNQVIDITPISPLVELEELNLNSNRIVDISPLSTLVSLRKLYLDNNQFVDVSPLISLNKLDVLHICNSDVVNMEVLLQHNGDIRELEVFTKTVSGNLRCIFNSIILICSIITKNNKKLILLLLVILLIFYT